MNKSMSILFALALIMSTIPAVTATDQQNDLCGNADVVIVIDRSGSMGGSPIAAAKTAAKSFVDLLSLGSGDEAASASFATTASLEQGLTDDGTAVKTAIDSISTGGLTCISCGIDIAQQEIDDNGRAGVTPVIVLLSDGVPTQDTEADAIAAAAAAKAAGTTIFTIGIGGADADLMENLASQTDYFSFGDTNDLDEIYAEIAGEVCKLPPEGGNDVPEFGTIATLTLLAGIGLFLMRKRK